MSSSKRLTDQPVITVNPAVIEPYVRTSVRELIMRSEICRQAIADGVFTTSDLLEMPVGHMVFLLRPEILPALKSKTLNINVLLSMHSMELTQAFIQSIISEEILDDQTEYSSSP